MAELAAGFGITPLASGGFGSWQKVTTLAGGIAETLGTSLAIAAIYDRDYFCDEEIAHVAAGLSGSLALARVHDRKEIENYLLVPAVLDRAISRAAERATRGEPQPASIPPATKLLREITDSLRDDVQSQLIARRAEYLRNTGKDLADITRETLSAFTPRWADLSLRLTLVPGKDVLRAFRERLQATLGISLSDARIVESFHRSEIPNDLIDTFRAIDRFRAAMPAT